MSTKNNILLTGGTGFLGSYISQELRAQNYDVTTLGRSERNDIKCDLSGTIPSKIGQPDMVIHSAGKAHSVPRSPEEAGAFYSVNERGTLNLLKGLDGTKHIPNTLVFISSVAVYGLEEGQMINENHPCLADSAYGKSKLEAEKILINWCHDRGVRLTILRLPLLVGKNPPGNLGAMIKWMKRGLYFGIGKGASKKSMVLASDVARFIPRIAAFGGTYNLTDGYHPSVCELENAMANWLGIRKPVRIPDPLINGLAKIGDKLGAVFPLNVDKYKKLTSTLTFSDKLVREKGWNPRTVISYLQSHE